MITEVQTLKELYIDHLKDIYSAECQVARALPPIINKATSTELKKGLQDHLTETVRHVDRLKRIFDLLEKSPLGRKCIGMEGVLGEAKVAMAEEISSAHLMDVALIGACQKVEHYEISAYGTARTLAGLLGEKEAVNLLTQTLEEEKAADQKLSLIGLDIMNPGTPPEPKAPKQGTPDISFMDALFISSSRNKVVNQTPFLQHGQNIMDSLLRKIHRV